MVKLRDFQIAGRGGDIDWKVPVEAEYKAGVHTLTYRAVAGSQSSSHGYSVAIQLLGILPEEILPSPDGSTDIPYISEKTFQNKDMKVDCGCMQYTMGGCLKGNLANGCALYTDKQFSDYERKTDNPNLTRNADKEPQMCKHLAGLVREIEHDFVLPTPDPSISDVVDHHILNTKTNPL